VIATLAAFLPTFQNGFVNSWDDGPNLLANRDYRGLGWTQLRWMFTTTHMGHWIPLTWMTFGLDHLVWGMNPAGYHLTSLLLHSANAVLCYALALGLLRAAMTGVTGATLRSGAVAAALFFAVHPLRVESVAWATERRDVLSGFFFLLTLLAYLRASASEGSARWRWLASSVACAVLALLSKAIVVGLPVILILLDVYPLRRLGWRPREWVTPRGRAVLAEKIPYVMLAIVGSAVALHAQSSLIVPLEAPSPLLRIEYVLYSLGFYVWKTVIPSALSPLYELAPRVDPRELRFIVSSIAVLAVSVALLFFRRRWPAGLAVWVAYAAMVAPVSGLFQSSARLLVADRYSYLPCIGLAILFGAGVCALVRALTMGNGSTRWLGRAGAGAVVGWIVVLGALTWRQVGVWHDPGTLWTHVLAVDPRSSVAHNNLGYFLKETGRLSEAAAHAEEALRINPSFVEADVNLGDVRVRQGNLDGAAARYRDALRLRPDFAAAHNGLGIALHGLGRPGEAIQEFQAATALVPDFAEAHYNLANALMRLDRWDEATAHFRAALQTRPDYAEAHNNLGAILLSRQQVDEAIAHFQRALEIDPTYRKARNNLDIAAALRKQGRR